MGVVASVDVPGGDLGPSKVRIVQREGPAVIRPPVHPVQRSGPIGVQLHQLAAGGRRVVRVGRHLAIHAQVPVGELDDPVGLACHHVGVLGQPHIQSLAAPSHGQEQSARGVADTGRDSHRALKGVHGTTKSLVGIKAGPKMGGAQGGHHPGVAADPVDQGQIGCCHKVSVVVDIPVLDGGDQRKVLDTGIAGSQRVGVGLRDEADAGPAGVAQDDALGVGSG